jgi:peroxiredoxin
MALSRSLQNVVLDLGAGAGAFVFFFTGLRLVPGNHASILFLLVETIYFLVAIVRSHSDSRSPLLRVLFMVVPGATTVLLLAHTGYAFSSRYHIICFLGAALLGTLSGTLLRRFYATEKTGLGSLAVAALLALNLLVVRIVIPGTLAALRSKDADQPAPSFTFSTIDGAVVGSDELRGRVVVLAFWATWCRPCIGELPRVQQVYQRYRNDPRVVIWVVNAGISNDTVEKQRKTILAQHWDLPFAEDSENLEHKMGLHGFPKLVVLDKTGRVRWVHDGFDGSEDLAGQLTKRIEELLRSG